MLATDADWIVDEVTAALGGPDTTFTVCREGRVVADVIAERTPDLAILDLQVGSMGGMAITMSLRLDESGGTLPHVPALMLLRIACLCFQGKVKVRPALELRCRSAIKLPSTVVRPP